MPDKTVGEPHATCAYVLARAFSRDGTVSGSRRQRLTCALVELRDRIKEQFLRVSKDWQVSAEELRRCYSYAYPFSPAGAPDPLCLEQACEGLMVALRSDIQAFANQFGVPDDLLESMLVDWLVSDAMGTDRTPSALLAPDEDEQAKRCEDPIDRLPSVMELLANRPRGADGLAERRDEHIDGGG